MQAKPEKKILPSVLPSQPEIPSAVSLAPEVRQAFKQTCEQMYQEAIARFRASGHTPPAPSSDELNAVLNYFASGGICPTPGWVTWSRQGPGNALCALLAHPQLPPVSMVRLLIWTRHCWLDETYAWHQWFFAANLRQLLQVYWKHHDLGMPLGLREVAALFQAAGVDARALGQARLAGRWWGQAVPWEPAATWPYFLEHLELLEEALDLRPPGPETRDQHGLWNHFRGERRQAAFEILGMFPDIPNRFVDYCWDVALGSAKTERSLARQALGNAHDKLARLGAALRNGKQDVRAAAAEWLAQIGDTEAIAPLRDALRKEKQAFVKGALMGALERLGVPLDQFLDRDGLRAEAEKGLQKGLPEDLAWFDFDQMPAIHWQDTGQEVPRAVVTWWLVQAFKFKNPEPSPVLRRYAGHLQPEQAHELGMFVLNAWIAHDTILPSHAEALRRTQQFFSQFGSYPGADHDLMLKTFAQQPVGSAVKEKGVLAVAGACCSGKAAAVVGDYLRAWYGQRAAQCKALLQMLSWIEQPAAIQLLLATAKKFRTTGIRQEAERLVHGVAERLDWTLDELADRTVSDCGLDAEGILRLDYGERCFTARLQDDLSLALADEQGNTLASLPEPRKSEDPDRVKLAKKQLAELKKELKVVVRQQQERLYEAMCTQRTWKCGDWDSFLHRHPIVGRMCQRLVWAGFQNETAVATFRPLADGSLTDYEDRRVDTAACGSVRIGHGSMLAEDLGRHWHTHFADYEVTPLFDQFGRPAPLLSDEKKQATTLNDFLGHLIDAFKLRGRATKLGYARGGTGDGGWFYHYRKPFPTARIEAVLEFSGNSLPEENHLVALQSLSFERTGNPGAGPGGESRPGWNTAAIPLEQVPPVLVAECWNDLRAIAADGKGFDPEWEKKIER